MRKGLTLTLMTVAIAMLGAQAQAMAPTISDIPSPVVSNDIPVTGGGQFGNFVYLDAMDLNTLATDDVTPAANLMWSYTGSLTGGGSSYRINGVAPLTGGADPTSPTTAMIINRNEKDPAAVGNTPNTITIRNNHLSPLVGTGSLPSTNGIVASETEPVTFFCSDGNAFSSQTVFFYTANNENDRLSGGDPFKPVDPAKPVDKITKFWKSLEWNAMGATGTNFSLTTSTVAGVGSGICFSTPLRAQNWGSLASAYPYFNLAANQVYRIKLKMSGSQATGGKTPYWNFILENFDESASNGTMNLYIFSDAVYDVQGGANAVLATPGTVTMYWAPPAVGTTQWNDAATGAFTSARDKGNDPRLRFRTIDVDGAGEGELRSGNLCIQEIEVAAAPLTRVQTVGTALVNITNFVDAKGTATSGKNVQFTPLAGSTATFSGGAVTIAPTTAGQTLELATLGPSTDGTFTGNPNTVSDRDEYPIKWVAGKILRMQVDMTAPTTADENSPWDAFCFLFLSWTNEVNTETYITSNAKLGSPRVGTTSTYTTFQYTGNGTKTTTPEFDRLRWEIRFFNSTSVNFPSGATTNTGGVKITRVNVQEVTFK
jgi:hypothetical protein